MDKDQAVEDAVATQLEQDGHPSNEPEKKMGANYKYSKPTMKIFLDAVKETLSEGMPSKGTPKYYFTYGLSFISEALELTVTVLIGKIDEKTSAAPVADALSASLSVRPTRKKRRARVGQSGKRRTRK